MQKGRDTVIEALNLARSGDIGRANRRLQRMRNQTGLEAEACYGLGLIEYCCNSLDSSEAYFCKATQIDPAHADAYYQLAKLADTRGDPVTATLYLRTALAQNPGHVMAAEALAEHDDRAGSQLKPSTSGEKSRVVHTETSLAGSALTSAGLNWKTVVSMIALAALAISVVQAA